MFSKNDNIISIKKKYILDVKDNDGIKIESTCIATRAHRRKGRMRGIQKIVPIDGIVFTFEKYKDGKCKPVIDVPLVEMMSEGSIVKVMIAVEKLGFDNSFNLLLDEGVTLEQELIKILGISGRATRDISSALLKNKIIHRVSKRHYILNPFVFCGLNMSRYKLFEAQMRWESFFFGGNKNALPFYEYSTGSIQSQEGYDEAVAKIAGEIGEDLASDIKKVMQHEVVEIPKEENDKLRNEWEKLRKIVAGFIKFYHEESLSLKLSLGSFSEYISTDKGARHFVSWWNKQHEKGNFGIEFKMPYRMRNKYCRLVAKIVSEYDLLINDRSDEMLEEIARVSGKTTSVVENSIREDYSIEDVYEHVVLRRKEFEFNKENENE